MPKISRGKILAAFLRQMAPFKWRIALLSSVVVSAYGAEMITPWAAKWLVDRLAAGPAVWQTVAAPFAFFAALNVAGWILWRLGGLISIQFEPDMIESGSKRLAFACVFTRPLAYFADTASGSIVRYVERFSESFNELFNLTLHNVLPTVIAVAVSLVGLSTRSWVLAAVFAAWIATIIALQWYLAKRQLALRKMTAAAEAKVSGYVADAIGNAVTVKTFAAEPRERAGLGRVLHSFVRVEKHAWFVEEGYWTLQALFFVALEVGLVGYVLYGWTKGRFTLGDFILVQGFLVQLFRFLSDFGRVFRRIPRLMANASDIVGMMHEPPLIQNALGAKSLRVTAGEIHFDHVIFAYKERHSVLKDFNLVIKPGEKVAFVGPSGAGKSTVVKLLYRFYDPTKGILRIDGQDISTVTQESLRHALALVPQDPALFHRSIFDNIRYARPNATEQEVMQAAKRAHCHAFVSRLSNGYKTLVGERGVKLSGGERQRVAIARAILADTPILVLDEATSSLDSESEALIQDALRGLMRDKTVLVIAHRLSTIMEMDRIVVIEKGKVADVGTHGDLLERDGTYRRLWNLQSGGYIQE